jgi:hypothetical protein
VKKPQMYYEESELQGKKFNIFRKEEKNMENKVKPTVKHKVTKTKNTLSVYTYLNFKQFGIAVRIDDGIKVTLAWFETHIKFEKK